MVAGLQNHWKTIGTNGFWTKNHWKNHWYQWFLDQKPLKTHWYQWFWRPKTIVKPLISMVVFQPFMVSMKTCKCCNGGNQKANIELKWFPRVTFVTLGQVSLSKVCLFLCFCWTNHVFFAFWPFFVNQRSLSPKPLINHRCKWWATNHSFNGNGSIVKNHWKNHWYKWLRSEKTIEKPLTPMIHM